jgi:hypothetical protein
MYVYLGFTISFLFSFGPEMGTLCVQLLWLVLGRIPLPPDDILQPPGQGIHQVLQKNIHKISISLVSTCNFIFHRSCRILRFFFLCMFLAVHFRNFLLMSPLTEISPQPNTIPGCNPPGDWQSAVGSGDAGFEPGTVGQQSGALPLSYHAFHLSYHASQLSYHAS